MNNSFKLGEKAWLQLKKDMLQGNGKKIMSLRYGPFKILENVGYNAYRLILAPYMFIYLVVNLESMKLYESSVLEKK